MQSHRSERNGRRPSGAAQRSQATFCSVLVMAGQRPRWLYRTEPMNEDDSGWRFFEGSEDIEWVNEAGNGVLQHLSHVADNWPELAEVLTDERPRSAWEWDESRGRYVEVTDWTDEPD
jgi:hypothetical protein